MKKKLPLLGFVFAIGLAGCGGSSEPGLKARYAEGIYSAAAAGYHVQHTAGTPVTVQATFSPEAITEIEITSHRETVSREAVNQALSRIPLAMVEQQTAEVDGVSGATLTSNAIIEAVKSCISQALSSGGYSPGTYSASAAGYHVRNTVGTPVSVRVDFSPNAIKQVKITSHRETVSREPVNQALSRIPLAMVEQQTAEVDGVSGATLTSHAIIQAAKACLAQAELPAD